MKKALLFLLGVAIVAAAQTLVQTQQINLTSAPWVPKQSVTVVSATTANSFPYPSGTNFGVCIVSNNIPMARVVDYNITNNAVVFLVPPVVGDVVQLTCW